MLELMDLAGYHGDQRLDSQGSAQRSQVLPLEIDVNWAGHARHTEIETELVEVLRGLHGA